MSSVYCTCSIPQPRHPIEVRRVNPHRSDGEGDEFDGFVQVEVRSPIAVCANCEREVLSAEARLLVRVLRQLAALQREVHDLRGAGDLHRPASDDHRSRRLAGALGGVLASSRADHAKGPTMSRSLTPEEVDAIAEAVAVRIERTPRVALTRSEAAQALGIGLTKFKQDVQPHLRVVREGSCVLIPVSELERWISERAEASAAQVVGT